MMAFIQKLDKMLHRFEAETEIYFSSSDNSNEDIYIEDIVKFKVKLSTQSQGSLYKLSDSESEEEDHVDDILSFRPFQKAKNNPINKNSHGR